MRQILFWIISACFSFISISMGCLWTTETTEKKRGVFFSLRSSSDLFLARRSTQKKLLFLMFNFSGTLAFYYSLSQFNSFGVSKLYFIVWAFCSLVLSATDFYYFLLPNRLLFFFFLLITGIHLTVSGQPLIPFLASGLILFLLFYLFYFFSNGLGGGDVKLAALIGYSFGYSFAISSVLFACVFALVYGLLKVKRQHHQLTPIPFGPFLFLGTWVVLLNSH